MITVEELHKSFDGVEVLKGVSLNVRDGEVVALIGPSGEGKSVLLRHLVGLLQPDSGRIRVRGKDLCCVSRRDLAEIRSRIGFLFQNGALFDSMTVYDNVAFPLREKTHLCEEAVGELVLGVLDQVGLSGAEEKYPAQLSGGMAKRVALARSLVLSPEIMLFDEPTTGLDPIIVHELHDLIASMHKRCGFCGIIVSHEIPGIFALVQKVALLHEGVVRFMGTPEEILSANDDVVQEFIYGSMPAANFQVAERVAARRAAARGTGEKA
jgi:phospholipid/cholesterol/gamma-HCH transport system ATP-binding protein